MPLPSTAPSINTSTHRDQHTARSTPHLLTPSPVPHSQGSSPSWSHLPQCPHGGPPSPEASTKLTSTSSPPHTFRRAVVRWQQVSFHRQRSPHLMKTHPPVQGPNNAHNRQREALKTTGLKGKSSQDSTIGDTQHTRETAPRTGDIPQVGVLATRGHFFLS